ncbi:SipW-dependent-type signal peptide-containing protein [Cuneatibacter caecimuris]|uniref:Putative ribosomally synthesized peptide with SipW-like signal peptide n=1 Tax=Cuneatibacter caecimuris TaxID=1796618 RepID=A0A4Q7PKD1_9FIRM|nr:SipW-dependent-type signal peptide-containing protein [Cuneatibacter caecimuris]RZT01181.1 putative ribosomally synthesized peptide with SipW-like signal peptide [Cuneatibacter caecimuris]
MKRIKKWQAILIAAVVICVCVTGFGSVYLTNAYLTDKHSVSNTFTIGDLLIDLKEPAWEGLPDKDGDGVPDIADGILPNTTVPKDPTVIHISGVSAYIYLEVTVPREDLQLVENQSMVTSPQLMDVYQYVINDGWTEISRQVSDKESKYLYAYTNKELSVGEKTIPLFNEVYYPNVLEGTLPEGEHQNIQIKAYAIQSKYLDVIQGDVTEKMTKAFKLYWTQRGDGGQ